MKSLASLALDKVCEDILRHTRSWQNESDDEVSNYWEFRLLHSDAVLTRIAKNLEQLCADIPHKYKHGFLDFIFNRFVRDIRVPSGGYSNSVLSAIVRNCKNLQFLELKNTTLTVYAYVHVFKGLTNIVRLNLLYCQLISIKIIDIIANSLTHLEILDLRGTDIDDQAIFRLCGHKTPDQPLLPSCCFSKQCKAVVPQKLRGLVLHNTLVSSLGIACLLTHFPTIKCIRPYFCERYSTADILCQISTYRQMCQMPKMDFEVMRLACPVGFRNWQSLFLSCSKIQDLELTVENDDICLDQVRDRGISELTDLKILYLYVENMSTLFTDSFRRIWRTRGDQLLNLGFCSTYSTNAEYDPRVFRKILSVCPSLKVLLMRGFVIRRYVDVIEGFPHLENVKLLTLQILGDPELVKVEIFKMISAARKVGIVMLDTAIEDREILDFVDRQRFPDLKSLLIRRGNRYLCYAYSSPAREGRDGNIRKRCARCPCTYFPAD